MIFKSHQGDHALMDQNQDVFYDPKYQWPKFSSPTNCGQYHINLMMLKDNQTDGPWSAKMALFAHTQRDVAYKLKTATETVYKVTTSLIVNFIIMNYILINI